MEQKAPSMSRLDAPILIEDQTMNNIKLNTTNNPMSTKSKIDHTFTAVAQ